MTTKFSLPPALRGLLLLALVTSLWIGWDIKMVFGQTYHNCTEIGEENVSKTAINPNERGRNYTFHTGERHPVNVVQGATYEFSTCGTPFRSSVVAHKTVLPGVFTSAISNTNPNNGNDRCNFSGRPPSYYRGLDHFEWTADYTGVLFLTVQKTSEHNQYYYYWNLNVDSDADACTARWWPTSSVMYIRQKNNVAVQRSPQDQRADCGDNVTFSVSGELKDGTVGTFTYAWEEQVGDSWQEIQSESSSTTFTLNNVGVAHFGTKIRAVVIHGGAFAYSDAATVIDNSVDAPSNVQATVDNCDGEITITWEWYARNPSSFLIEMSEDKENWEDLAEPSGGIRQYVHQVQRGVTKYYRVRTYSDSCGLYTSSSEVVQGISPLDPSYPINVSVAETRVDGGKAIEVSWEDSSSNEDGFFVEKVYENGISDRFRVRSESDEVGETGEVRTYIDDAAENCELYEYRVYAYNTCIEDGVRRAGEEASITFQEDISNVVSADMMEVSKGYYSDRVDLDWQINPEGNYRFIDRFKLYARELGTDVVPAALQTIQADKHSTEDLNSEASVLYEYFLVAEGECGTETITSFDMSTLFDVKTDGDRKYANLPDDFMTHGVGVGYSIGFRSPVGVVNGNISYRGGVAVPNVKIIAERQGDAPGRSLHFDGSSAYVTIDPSTYLGQIDEEFSFSVWVRPEDLSRSEEQVIYDLSDIVILTINAGQITFSVMDDTRSFQSISSDAHLRENEYCNVTTTYRGGRLRLYIDGELESELVVPGMNLSEVVDSPWHYTGHLDPSTDSEEIARIEAEEASIGYLYLGGSAFLMERMASGQGNNNYKGKIDELRLFDKELSAERIRRDYTRYLPHNAPDLIGYWRMDEGAGRQIFDLARSGSVYHGSDGKISNATWSTIVPDGRRLGMAGYSDQYGNYTVAGILYTGNGETFTITPSITLSGAVHEFTPNQRVLFIGEGSSSINNIDFEDISSFRVAGQVVFEYDSKESGSAGVQFFVDGTSPVLASDGTYSVTDENGNFEIEVPIGMHHIVARKPYHTMKDEGRWPTTSGDKYDFQDELSGLKFVDETRRTVIGRVVGGTREGDKKVGFDLSTNNIGTAQFRLVSQDGIIDETVSAEAISGEYSVSLPPKEYTIYKVSPSNELGINVQNNPEAENFFSSLDNMDLTSIFLEQKEYQQDLDLEDEAEELDTEGNAAPPEPEGPFVTYHLKRNFVYRSAPTVSAVNEADEPSRIGRGVDGLEKYNYATSSGQTDRIDLKYGQPGGIPHPVYETNSRYGMRISIQETYVNKDNPANPVTDSVPVTDAILTITNYIGKGYYQDEDTGDYLYYAVGAPGTQEEIEITTMRGDTLYTFFGNVPETSLNLSDRALSFTRTMQITARAGGNVSYWPGGNDAVAVHRGYVFGSQAIGSSFVTQGPEIVDFVLRDPPGSESFTVLERGTTLSFGHSASLITSLNFEAEVKAGVDNHMLVGVGVSVLVQASSKVDLGFELGLTLGFEGEWVNSYTTTTAIATSGDPEWVGAAADVYVGSSQNFQYGNSISIALVKSSDCGTEDDSEVLCPLESDAITLVSEKGENFEVGARLGLFLNPMSTATTFVYTQSHIEDILIPALMRLRNSLLLNSPNYSSKVSSDHEMYGSNNDDPEWSSHGETPTTTTINITEAADFNGPSYTFTQPNRQSMDSIRWFNQQVALWEKAIADNEKAKVDAKSAGGADNISLSSQIEYSSTSTHAYEKEESFVFELAGGFSAGFDSDFNIFGVAFSATFTFGIEITAGYGYTYGYSEEVTYGYTLLDEGETDFLSIDVYTGSEYAQSPIFAIKDGGETSCPHEPGYVTKYYRPGTRIGTRTLKIEEPRLEVAVAEVFNIPSDEAAVFVLNLHNDSETNEDADYALLIREETNPHGASFEVDGAFFDKRRIFKIPQTGAIQKILTMRRGPYEYDYEDIEVVLTSVCEEGLESSVEIAAHFLPACTESEIRAPKDNWVLNYELDNKMDLVIGGFDLNYAGFEKIDLRYRPTSVSGWIMLESFYKDAEGDANKKEISRSQPTISYEWDVTNLSDGMYEILATTYCKIASTGTEVAEDSEVMSGRIDRINPHPFGQPQPADGILSPSDEIMVQFNEPINEGQLISQNFAVTGILNGGALRHPASIFFSGSDDNYMRITGIDLSQRSFTLDFYARRRRNSRKEVLISQGKANDLQIGFDTSNHPFFTLDGKTLTGTHSIGDTNWHHYAITYNMEAGTASISVDAVAHDVSNNFMLNYQVTGDILLAKTTYTPTENFRGNVHELRVWNRALSESDVNIVATQRLDRSQRGLVSNWRMEEVEGSVAVDHIRRKDAEFKGTWQIEPGGRSLDLTANNAYAEIPSVAFGVDNDFTIEFWFTAKSGSREVSLLSSGRGDATDPNASGWNIGIDATGNLFARNTHVASESQLVTRSTNYHDDQWHHVALVSKRIGNTLLVVDGEEQASALSGTLKGFAGPKLWLGARGWFAGTVENRDSYMDGQIDDLRVWGTARTIEQVKQHRFNRLSGDERGLVRHYPFEEYQENSGVFLVTTSTDNEVVDGSTSPLSHQGSTLSTLTPAIKIPLPKQNLSFNYSANRDKIILSPTESNARIENVILDITVQDVRDLSNNKLLSPITWSAFVDRNQVIWTKEKQEVNIALGQNTQFVVPIQNNGGEVQSFSISNLPTWVSATPTSGTITPLSTQDITFSIRGDVNIGEYSQDIYLRSDFGYDERLSVEASVYAAPPEDWTVEEEKYQYAMSIVSQLRIDGSLSRDKNDQIVALVDGEVRGKAQLQYVPGLDAYFAFLTIYSAEQNGDPIKFQVWNASHGRIQANITPTYTFAANTLEGSVNAPVIFEVPDFVSHTREFKPGWQWISFGLSSPGMNSTDELMSDYEAEEGDIIKDNTYFDQYDETNGWIGSISENGGMSNDKLYKLKLKEGGDFTYEGNVPELESVQIVLKAGWNWISFLPQRSLSLDAAFANFEPQTGDEIKSQLGFALYAGPGVGWVGSLKVLSPNQGYMYKSARDVTFTYPNTAAFFSEIAEEEFLALLEKALPNFDYAQFQSNMTMVVKVENYALTGNEAIIVTAEQEKRGFGVLLEVLDGEYLYFLTVWGDATADPLSFFLKDEKGNEIPLVASERVNYRDDASVGNLNEPIILRPTTGQAAENQTGASVSILPNPVKDKMSVLLSDPQEQVQQVELFTIDGHFIAGIELTKSEREQQYDIFLERYLGDMKGILIVKIHTNKEVHTLKIIRQ